MKGKSI